MDYVNGHKDGLGEIEGLGEAVRDFHAFYDETTKRVTMEAVWGIAAETEKGAEKTMASAHRDSKLESVDQRAFRPIWTKNSDVGLRCGRRQRRRQGWW